MRPYLSGSCDSGRSRGRGGEGGDCTSPPTGSRKRFFLLKSYIHFNRGNRPPPYTVGFKNILMRCIAIEAFIFSEIRPLALDELDLPLSFERFIVHVYY